jgi:ribokinase
MKVLLNPAPAPSLTVASVEELLAEADYITPNRGEALTLAGNEPAASSDLARCAARLLELGPKIVLMTLGSEGCLVASGSDIQRISAPRVEAVDTVGAGDAFNGALAVALAENRPLIEAASWATAAAALAVTKSGAQAALPHRQEIDSFYALAGTPT